MRSKRKERNPGMVDVIDRVLDKGIIVDAVIGVDVLGLGLRVIEIDAHVVVASLDTYLRYTALSSGTFDRKPTDSLVPEPRPIIALEQIQETVDAEHYRIIDFSDLDKIRAHGLGIRLQAGRGRGRRSSQRVR